MGFYKARHGFYKAAGFISQSEALHHCLRPERRADARWVLEVFPSLLSTPPPLVRGGRRGASACAGAKT